MKKNNFSNFVLPFLFGIILVFISLFFSFNSLEFFNPFPIRFLKYSEKTVHIVEFSDMQSLYFSFALGIPGIYLTMLSISLNARQNLSIGTFFKYVINKSIILLLTLFVLFCFFNLILPYLKLTQESAFSFQIISIIELFIFAVASFKTLSFIENPNSCAKLYKKNCFSKGKIDKDESEKFYFSFIRPAFQDNSFSVFEAIKEMKSSDKNGKFYDYEILNNLLDNLEFKKDSKVLLKGLKKLAEYITFYSGKILYFGESSDKTLEALNKYIELYFKFYEQLFFCNAVEYPYILESAQFLRDFLQNRENVKNSRLYNSVCSLYSKILVSSKRMVVLSIYRCDSVNIHSHIADFMNLSQGLEFNCCEENRNLLKKYEYFFVDILTHLINLVQMQRIDKNNLLFVFRGLEQINQIEIMDIDFEPYFEILPNVNWHENIYRRIYYITILLVLCKNKNENLYKQIFKKLSYKSNTFDDLKCLYFLLKENIEKITEDDLFLIDSEHEILNSLTFVKENINEKIENLKNSRLNSLINSDVSNELNVAVNNLENNLKTNFKSLWNENLASNNYLYFPFRVEFSVNLLTEGKYNQNYTSLENLLWESICNQFLKNAEKLFINSINDISDLKNQKEIFISSKAFDSLVSDKNFKFSGQQVEINKTVLKVKYISQKEKCIILPEDIEKSLSITAITNFQDKAEKIVKNDDVIISVLFHLIIEQKKSKGKAYILG